MTFTKLVDTKHNVSAALSDLTMVKHWVESVKDGTAGEVTINKILEYCEYAAIELKYAQDCLQVEVDRIFEEESK